MPAGEAPRKNILTCLKVSNGWAGLRCFLGVFWVDVFRYNRAAGAYQNLNKEKKMVTTHASKTTITH